MGIIDKIFSFIGGFFKGLIEKHSYTELALLGASALILLSVIGIVLFFFYLIFKIFNHGGYK